MDIPDLALTLGAMARILKMHGWFVVVITHACFKPPAYGKSLIMWTEAWAEPSGSILTRGRGMDRDGILIVFPHGRTTGRSVRM